MVLWHNKRNAVSTGAKQSGTAANGPTIILQPFASFYLSGALYTLSMKMKDCRYSLSILFSIKYVFKASPWAVKTSSDTDLLINEDRFEEAIK